MKIVILGATGAVGQEIIGCLKKLDIPVTELVVLASARSAGKKIQTPFGKKEIAEVNEHSFDGADYAIFSAGAERSRQWAPVAQAAGCVVIDNSSAFRYDDAVPLVIPEINGEKAKGASLIANPNCTTAIAAVVLYPLYKVYGLRKVIVATYQAASGAGAEAMRELTEETRRYLEEGEAGNTLFAHPLPFNLIPRIDAMQENGYTKEEMKVAWEMRKIFDDDALQISCSAVRVPVLRAHSESIVVETEKPVDPDDARELLRKAPGIEVRDDPAQDVYPMPLTAAGKYAVEVGRIRRNVIFGKHGLEIFISGDQLLKGAALNAAQIVQLLVSD